MYTMHIHIYVWKDGKGVCMYLDKYYHFKNKARNINWKSVTETHKVPK